MAGSDVRVPLIEVGLATTTAIVVLFTVLRMLPSTSLVRDRLSMEY